MNWQQTRQNIHKKQSNVIFCVICFTYLSSCIYIRVRIKEYNVSINKSEIKHNAAFMYIRKLKIGHSLGDSSEITTFRNIQLPNKTLHNHYGFSLFLTLLTSLSIYSIALSEKQDLNQAVSVASWPPSLSSSPSPPLSPLPPLSPFPFPFRGCENEKNTSYLYSFTI